MIILKDFLLVQIILLHILTHLLVPLLSHFYNDGSLLALLLICIICIYFETWNCNWLFLNNLGFQLLVIGVIRVVLSFYKLLLDLFLLQGFLVQLLNFIIFFHYLLILLYFFRIVFGLLARLFWKILWKYFLFLKLATFM